MVNREQSRCKRRRCSALNGHDQKQRTQPRYAVWGWRWGRQEADRTGRRASHQSRTVPGSRLATAFARCLRLLDAACCCWDCMKRASSMYAADSVSGAHPWTLRRVADILLSLRNNSETAGERGRIPTWAFTPPCGGVDAQLKRRAAAHIIPAGMRCSTCGQLAAGRMRSGAGAHEAGNSSQLLVSAALRNAPRLTGLR
jgi:hypothetical protein